MMDTDYINRETYVINALGSIGDGETGSDKGFNVVL